MMSDVESGNQIHSNNVNLKNGTQNSLDKKKSKMELYKAALSNNWKEAENLFDNEALDYGEIITSRGETSLHIAVLAGHADFVQKLVQKMDSAAIRIETRPNNSGRGNTAFHCAVISGDVNIAKSILKTEDLHDLAMTRGAGWYYPIHIAAEKGNIEMVRFLYDFAYKNHLEDPDSRTFLVSLIKSNIFDFALQMAKALISRKEMPTHGMEEEALQELALKPINPPGFLDKLFHRQVVGMHRNAVQLVELLWDSLASDEERLAAFINSPDPNPIIEAAKRGNFHFLSILVAKYPDILFTYDRNKYTVIHHAILNRHVDIFKFISIGSAKTIVTTYRDREGNNMLHLAAKLAPPSRLNIVPGAALQLQRELLWFEEVKKVMEPYEVDRKRHYLSDFPLDKMLSLIQEMKVTMRTMPIMREIPNFFTDLATVLFEKTGEAENYFPHYESASHSKSDPMRDFSVYILTKHNEQEEDMNQSDVILLFKELKKVMEQQNDQLQYYVKLLTMLDVFQEIDQYEPNGSDYSTVLKKVGEAMGRHDKLRQYSRYMEIWRLYQHLNEWMERFDPNRSDATEELHKELNAVVGEFKTLPRPIYELYYDFKSYFEEIEFHVKWCQPKNLIYTTLDMNVRHQHLKEHPPREPAPLFGMLELFQGIDRLMHQYNHQNRNDGREMFQLLKDMMVKTKWKRFNDHKRVINLFQEMKEVMEQHDERNKNDKLVEEYTPHDVFVKEHENLMEKGEKWMRDTANSCMIVAVLITTIAFAAAITVPGGNGDDGYPNFSEEPLFIAFAIADTISMISSAVSLLNFLSILTARYTIDGFRWSLPNKLFVGLSTIFMSVAAMMVAFVLSIFIIFTSNRPAFPIPVAAASSVPIALFLWQHWGLLVDVFRSTYASYFLFKPNNDSSSVFKPSFRVKLQKRV